MRKTISILCFMLLCLTISAQKADVSSNKFLMNFNAPEYIKSMKTFYYEIQDDGVYWNYEPTPEQYPEAEFPNLASLTDGLKLTGLESVNKSEDADLKIVVGFLGNQLNSDKGLISISGTYNLLLLTKDNKLIYSIKENAKISKVVNPETYPTKTREQRNQTKAKLLTSQIQKELDKLNFLFTESAMQELPFARFKKTRGGKAEAFNTESTPLVDAIIKNSNDSETLDKAIAFWKSQIDVDFGKKVKEKQKNRVIYVNLASASILKKDHENANLYMEKAIKASGFFSLWTTDYTRFKAKQDLLKSLNEQNFTTIELLPKTAYFYVFNTGGVYSYKNKETEYTKVEIERFVPKIKSGISSIDSTVKPGIFVYYKKGESTKGFKHFSGEKNKIITSDGKEIIFKKVKNTFKPFLKQEDGSYAEYQAF